jgi:hypothetical protein
MRVPEFIVTALLAVGAYFAGVSKSNLAAESTIIQLEESIEERLVAETHELARRRGIRWDETELTYAAPIAAYADIPIGLAWQFRVWENGGPYVAWGQIVRDESVRSLFRPSRQQAAQAIRTLRRGAFWFAVVDTRGNQLAKEIWAKHNKNHGVPDPEILLENSRIREPLVKFIVNEAWRARGDRYGQSTAIIEWWNKWDRERSKP